MHTYAKKLIAASEGREGQPLHALEIEATCRVLATIGKKVDEADAELGVYHGGAIWERLSLWKEQMEAGEGKWDLGDDRFGEDEREGRVNLVMMVQELVNWRTCKWEASGRQWAFDAIDRVTERSHKPIVPAPAPAPAPAPLRRPPRRPPRRPRPHRRRRRRRSRSRSTTRSGATSSQTATRATTSLRWRRRIPSRWRRG